MSEPEPHYELPEVLLERRFQKLEELIKANGAAAAASSGKLQDTVDGTNRRIDVSNGRVAKLEEWKTEQDKRLQLEREVEQYEAGLADGKSEELARMRRRDKAVLGLIVGTVTLLGPFIHFLLERYW